MPMIQGAALRGRSTADMKVRRESLGLTQGWMAEQLGVQDRAIRRWEAGDREIPEDVWIVLDRAEAAAYEILWETIRGIRSEVVDIEVYDNAEDFYEAWDMEPYPASFHRAAVSKIPLMVEGEIRFHYPRRAAGTDSSE